MNIEEAFKRMDEKLAEIIGHKNTEQYSFGSLEECCSYYLWLTTPLFVDDDLC